MTGKRRQNVQNPSDAPTAGRAASRATTALAHRFGRRSLAAYLAAAGCALALAGCGGGGDDTPATNAYPQVTDTSHGTADVSAVFKGFFTAKSLHHGADMVPFFAPDPIIYIDAQSYGLWPDRASLLAVWTSAQFAGGPPTALSYPLRVVGDCKSAVVEFVDTPDLLGADLRFFGSVTFDDKCQIVRWVDYADNRSANRASANRTPLTNFNDSVSNASTRLKLVAQALQTAYSAGNAAAAAALFTPDAVYEDMALHTRIEGQVEIQRYLTRAVAAMPFGTDAALVHVSGSDQGGGFEWSAATSFAPLKRGITVIELDAAGKITRLSSMFDSGRLPYATYQTLVNLAAEKPLP
jgi:hypothetical protein